VQDEIGVRRQHDAVQLEGEPVRILIPGSSCLPTAVGGESADQRAELGLERGDQSLTGPGRAPISRAALAMKQPPGNVRRSRCAKNASHTAVS
jgi:hypothetical protein